MAEKFNYKGNNPISVYYYDDCDILVNKLNIKDPDELRSLERSITALKIARLNSYFSSTDDLITKKYDEEKYENIKEENPVYDIIPFDIKLDEEHLCNIHRYIFHNIYDFAGDYRYENIHKTKEPYGDGLTLFGYCQMIPSNLREILSQMRNSARSIYGIEGLSKKLAHYYLELMAIHPFREGNGRTIREFMREYVLALNTIIDFGYFEFNLSDLDVEEKDELQKYSVLEDEENLSEIFKKILTKEKDNRKVM